MTPSDLGASLTDPDDTGVRIDWTGQPLAWLRAHGPATTREIADAVGLSAAITWSRLRRLKGDLVEGERDWSVAGAPVVWRGL